MTCQSPNADSGRVSAGSSFTKSSNMYLCDAESNPPDADDLEVCLFYLYFAIKLSVTFGVHFYLIHADFDFQVAMINQSFEEQQKQTKLYASPGLKDLFYSQPNTIDDHAAKETVSIVKHSLLVPSDTHNGCNEGPLFPADLLLTGISSNSVVPRKAMIVGSPWTVCNGL